MQEFVVRLTQWQGNPRAQKPLCENLILDIVYIFFPTSALSTRAIVNILFLIWFHCIHVYRELTRLLSSLGLSKGYGQMSVGYGWV